MVLEGARFLARRRLFGEVGCLTCQYVVLLANAESLRASHVRRAGTRAFQVGEKEPDGSSVRASCS